MKLVEMTEELVHFGSIQVDRLNGLEHFCPTQIPRVAAS